MTATTAREWLGSLGLWPAGDTSADGRSSPSARKRHPGVPRPLPATLQTFLAVCRNECDESYLYQGELRCDQVGLCATCGNKSPEAFARAGRRCAKWKLSAET